MELIKDYDYYDVASYLASREYSSIPYAKQDISDAEYIKAHQNERLEGLITEQSSLYNYSIICDE